jgi:rsbT co-antagonist protein RsbR
MSLLHGLSSSRGSFAIIDITGVSVVDTQVANALIRAAHAARLLGAQVILTGIRPEVAQTLATLDTDLSAVTTRGTLQSGIAFALALGRKSMQQR